MLLNAAMTQNSVNSGKNSSQLMMNNLLIAVNVIRAACRYKAARLVNMASATIYLPDAKTVAQGGAELLTESGYRLGAVEKATDRSYVLPKQIGVEICNALTANGDLSCVSIVPSHVCGLHYRYGDPNRLTVIPALIKRFYEAVQTGAEEVVIWGTGNLRRELISAADVAQAYVALMENPDASGIYNVGYGSYITIREIAETIRDVSGFQGKIVFDPDKPEATELKLLCSDRIRALGWTPTKTVRECIREACQYYLDTVVGGSV